MTTTQAERIKGAVRSFWERTLCDSWDATAPQGSREYFDQVERRRYELEPFIPGLAGFESAKDRDVLHHHMESLGTQGFTKREMFAGLDDLEVGKVCAPYDVEYAGGLARLTASSLGFFTLIRGRKPSA